MKTQAYLPYYGNKAERKTRRPHPSHTNVSRNWCRVVFSSFFPVMFPQQASTLFCRPCLIPLLLQANPYMQLIFTERFYPHQFLLLFSRGEGGSERQKLKNKQTVTTSPAQNFQTAQFNVSLRHSYLSNSHLSAKQTFISNAVFHI